MTPDQFTDEITKMAINVRCDLLASLKFCGGLERSKLDTILLFVNGRLEKLERPKTSNS
jgi:hypothetical protein